MSDPAVDYQNTKCDWCGKSFFNMEKVTKTISNISYTLCEYCSNFNNFNEVKTSYAEHISDATSGLFPIEVDWL